MRSGLFGRRRDDLHAVDGVSLTLRRGDTVGVVGESGSGKSTLGRAILRLRAVLRRHPLRGPQPRCRSTATRMQPLRRQLQLVFQDPFGSLSPRMTVGEIVTEGLLVHEPGINRAERDRRAAQALEEVQPRSRPRATASRTNSPAASASASPSPAP